LANDKKLKVFTHWSHIADFMKYLVVGYSAMKKEIKTSLVSF